METNSGTNATNASNSATAAASQQSIKAYVDSEVAGLVDSSPSALNTLNELAAALGDEENYASTITTSLAGKVATTGDETISGGPDPGKIGVYLYESDGAGGYTYVWHFITPDPGNSLPGLTYGDIDGDGINDIIIGEQSWGADYTTGKAYIYLSSQF